MRETYHTIRVALRIPGKPKLTAQTQQSELLFKPDKTTLVSVEVGIGAVYSSVVIPFEVLKALIIQVEKAAKVAQE